MTPYLTSVTTNQMAGFIKNNLEAEGAEVFVIDTANDFAELASRIEDVVSSGTDGIVLVSADPNQVANQLTEAFDADIPVFGCDSGFIDGMQVNATSDNYQMGTLAYWHIIHIININSSPCCKSTVSIPSITGKDTGF